MAGPNPFHKAVTPSAAMSFRAQSRIPVYVPCGADWSRDLMVCWLESVWLACFSVYVKVIVSQQFPGSLEG